MTTAGRRDRGAGGGGRRRRQQINTLAVIAHGAQQALMQPETRQSNRGTAVEKNNNKRRAPAPDEPFYFPGSQHTRFQSTAAFLHISASTCFGRSVHRRWRRRRRDAAAAICPHRPHKRSCHSPRAGLGYIVFLTSRCYGTRPHDKWHSPYQLLKNTPYFQMDARRMRRAPRPYLATDQPSAF